MGKCEEKRDRFRPDALAAWTHYQTTGLHATAEETDAWLAKLEAGEEAATPTLTKRPKKSFS
jgi:predicted transcriptional regulator